MFSTAQKDFLDSFLPVIRKSGYKHYLAYTDSNVNGSYYNSIPDLYIIVSDEEIVSSDGYSYSFSGDCLRFSVRTYNYSSGSYANNTERISCTSFSGSVTVSVYEHIFTNSSFTSSVVQPDYYLSSGGGQVEAITSCGIILSVVLLLCIFVDFFKGIFS